MSDPLQALVTAAAGGTVSSIAEAAAMVSSGVWVSREDIWHSVTSLQSDTPPTAATVVEVGRHCLALFGDAAVVGLVQVGLARIAAEEGRRAVESRLALNERIGGIGSYDWKIAENTNDWSDELYRIYGHEPGAFDASYERFIELVHEDDRDRIRQVHETAYATGEPYEMEEHIVRPDGSVRTLWSNGAVIPDNDGTPLRMVGVCRDITEQRDAERRAAAQHDQILKGELLRKQALELNDNVVQGLAVVVWTIDDGAPQVARAAAIETLDHARSMMHELHAAADATVDAGSLVRAAPARVSVDTPSGVPTERASGDRCRLVLADDAEDLRYMLRVKLQMEEAVEVVGEAGDGYEAVEAVARTRPDAVLLDLSMPRMDGLEACARIRSANPDIRIVILSGWGAATMGTEALAAGADAYVEKGASVRDILAVVLGDHEKVA